MDLSTVRFGVGFHGVSTVPTGERDMCIMEAVAFVAGEAWSDRPACASPVVAAFLRSWNDGISDDDRDRLLPAAVWVPRLVGSRGDDATEERRAYLALDWLVRVHSPAWLDLVPSLAPHAAGLRALPEIVDMTTAGRAGDTVRAAGDAARDAAWAAARAAAGAALRPTVETLQQSAHGLLDRMLACGEHRREEE